MSVIKVLRDLNGLFNYSTDENPTSQQDYQEAVKNWVKTIVSLVDINLWQPETEYVVGDTVYVKFMQNKGGVIAVLFQWGGAYECIGTTIQIHAEKRWVIALSEPFQDLKT